MTSLWVRMFVVVLLVGADGSTGSLITEGRELIAELIACTVAKEPPSYAHVLDLDARLRHLGTLSLDRTGYPMLAVCEYHSLMNTPSLILG
jgi:hypothetical protein